MVDAHIRATYSYKGEQEGEVVRRLREEREEEKDILLLLLSTTMDYRSLPDINNSAKPSYC